MGAGASVPQEINDGNRGAHHEQTDSSSSLGDFGSNLIMDRLKLRTLGVVLNYNL
jgi:hypothetical protein